jgi:cysteine synthase
MTVLQSARSSPAPPSRLHEKQPNDIRTSRRPGARRSRGSLHCARLRRHLIEGISDGFVPGIFARHGHIIDEIVAVDSDAPGVLATRE